MSEKKKSPVIKFLDYCYLDYYDFRKKILNYYFKTDFGFFKFYGIYEEENEISVFQNLNTKEKTKYNIKYLYELYNNLKLKFTEKYNFFYGDTMYLIDYDHNRIYCEQVNIIGYDVCGNVFYNSICENYCYKSYEEALKFAHFTLGLNAIMENKN